MLERFQEIIDSLSFKISGPEVEESESLAERRRRGSPQSVLLVLLNMD
jgi:hypothetical protein